MSDFGPLTGGAGRFDDPQDQPQPSITSFRGAQAPTWSQSLGMMISPDSDVSRRLQLIRSVAPSLMDRLDYVMPLASSGLPDDELVRRVQSAMGAAVTYQEAQAMGRMDPTDRAVAWDNMTADRQAAFKAANFDFSPKIQTAGVNGGGDAITNIGHGLGWMWGKTGGAVIHETTQDVAALLNDLGSGIRATQHAYRALHYLGTDQTFRGSWSRTTNGERYFVDGAVSDANEQLGNDPDKLYLAQMMAHRGASIENILDDAGMAPGSSDYSNSYRQLLDTTSNDSFKRAVEILNRGHSSPGRDLMRGVGLGQDDSGAYSFLSGLVDGSFDLLADPLIVAGKVAKGYRIAQYGVEFAEAGNDLGKFGMAVEHLPELDRVALDGADTRRALLAVGSDRRYFSSLARLNMNPAQRYATMVSDHFAVGANPNRLGTMIDHLAQTDPRIAKVLKPLQDYDLMLTNGNELGDPAAVVGRGTQAGISKPSDFVRFISDGDGLNELASGRWGSYAHRGVEMPHMTRLQSMRVAAKIGTANTIDFIAHGLEGPVGEAFDARSASGIIEHVPGRRLSDTQELARGLLTPDHGPLPQMNEAVRRLMQPVAKVVQSLTTLKPTRDILQLAGEDSYQSLSRFLGYAYSNDERARIVDAYFNAAPGRRIDIIKSAIPEMLRRFGVLDTATGREFADKVANSGDQAYARFGEDLMSTGTSVRPAGIMPEVDQAWAAGLPGYDDMLKMGGQARRLSLQHALFGSVPASWGDAFLSTYWKPSVLARIGFIPRVAGEEALGAVARLGAAFLPQRWLGEIGNQPDFVHLGPFRAAMNTLRYHIPDGLDFGEEITGTQRARAIMANLVEATSRQVTPVVRAAARTGQAGFTLLGTPLHEGLAEGLGRRLGGGASPEFGSIGDRIDLAKQAITDAQQSSAAASLAKMFSRMGNRFVPGEGVVSEMPRDEIEARLRMAGRFTRDPRAQDAIVRGLSQGWGKVSSGTANLITAGDDPSLTVLERGPNGDLTPVKLHTVGSQFIPYASGDPYFSTSMNWQIGRLAQDRVAMADAAISSMYIHPEQAMEVNNLLGGDDGFEIAQNIRRALEDSPAPLRHSLRRYLGADPVVDDMAKLKSDLSESLLYVKAEDRPLITSLFDHLDEMTSGTANMLAVDTRVGRGLLAKYDPERIGSVLEDVTSRMPAEAGLAAERGAGETGLEVAQHEAHDLTPTQAAYRSSANRLVEHLENGDHTVLDDARRRAVRSRLMDPDMARFRELSERNAFTAGGRRPELPIPANHARLHAVMMHPDEAYALQVQSREQALAAISDPQLRPLVSAMLDESSRMPMRPDQLGELRSTMGRGAVSPVSSLMFEDPDFAQRVADAMGESLDVTGGMAPGGFGRPVVGHVDVHRSLLDSQTVPMVPSQGIYSGRPSALLHTAVEDSSTSYRDVIDDWVSHITDQMNLRTMSQRDGRVLHEVTRPLLDGDWNMNHLAKVESLDLPAHIVGPQYMKRSEGVWSKIVRWGFDKVLGPGIDAMIREPLFAEHYMRALRGNTGIEERFKDTALEARATEIMNRRGLDPEMVREQLRDLPLEAMKRDGPTSQLPDLGLVRQHLPPEMGGISDRLLSDLHSSVLGDYKLPGTAPRAETDATMIDTRLQNIEYNEGRAGSAWVNEQKDKLASELGITRDELARGEYHLPAPTAPTPALPEFPEYLQEELRRAGVDPEKATAVFHENVPRSLLDPLAATMVDAPELRRLLGGTELGGLTDGELGSLRSWHNNQDAAENLAHNSAIDRATNETIPYIHDHHVRSQFADWTRHFMPFEFAEEQFLKRWAKTLAYAPEALEKGQLLLHGLRHSGLVQKDNFGNDVFIYPFSGAMTGALNGALKHFTGSDYSMPLTVPLVGDVKYTLPGMNHEGLPGVSPIAAVSMGLLRRRFPELMDRAEQAVVGERGAGHSVADMILPRQVMGLYRYWSQDPEKDAKLSSASIQVMTMMAAKDAEHFRATGEHLMPGLADDATNNDWEKFVERSVRYTRSLQLMRTLIGYAAPASPAPLYEGDLHPYLTQLLKAMPDQPAAAFAEFINQYPDASAYEVFGTKTQSGMPLPSSKAVADFLHDNASFVSRYKYASSVLAPPPSNADEPSKDAYRESMATELRINKSPEEWYKDWKFASAAPAYFASRDAHDQVMASYKGNATARDSEAMSWKSWQDSYFAAHPIFHEELLGKDAKSRRGKVLDEMSYALYDPEVPEGPHVQNLRDLLQGLHNYQTGLAQLGTRRDNRTVRLRSNLQAGFGQWVKAFTTDNPDTLTFYQRNIEPDLNLPDDQQTQVVNG